MKQIILIFEDLRELIRAEYHLMTTLRHGIARK